MKAGMEEANKDIHGHASIGRDVTVGGSTTVRGDTEVGHNLRVGGWLDAPNVVGPLKGLFRSEESLNRHYPRPRPGWHALVGDTLPAEIWVGFRGKWIPTGKYGGEPSLRLVNIEEDIAELRDGILTGAEITGDRDSGTLRLETHGRDIECEIPIVSPRRAGFMTADDYERFSSILQRVEDIIGSGTGAEDGSLIVDRGPWRIGERYYAGDENPVTGKKEISDSWRWGCRWRCPETGVATKDNGPGYYGRWPLISGDNTPRIVTNLDDAPGECMLTPGGSVDVECRLVTTGGEELGSHVENWSIERKGGDAEADAVWNNSHLDFDGGIRLGTSDFGFLARKGIFEVTAVFAAPETDSAAASSQYERRMERARLIIR